MTRHIVKLEEVQAFLNEPIETYIVASHGRSSNKSLTRFIDPSAKKPVYYILQDHDKKEAYYTIESAVAAYNERL